MIYFALLLEEVEEDELVAPDPDDGEDNFTSV